jgi:hypothetical protein
MKYKKRRPHSLFNCSQNLTAAHRFFSFYNLNLCQSTDITKHRGGLLIADPHTLIFSDLHCDRNHFLLLLKFNQSKSDLPIL